MNINPSAVSRQVLILGREIGLPLSSNGFLVGFD